MEVGSNNPVVNEGNQCCRSCGLAAESLGVFSKQSVLSGECWDRLQPAQGTGILSPRLALPGDTLEMELSLPALGSLLESFAGLPPGPSQAHPAFPEATKGQQPWQGVPAGAPGLLSSVLKPQGSPMEALQAVHGKEHGQSCPLLESLLIPGLGAPASFEHLWDSPRLSPDNLKPREQLLSGAEEPPQGCAECQAMWQTGDKGGFQHWGINGSEEFRAASGDPRGFENLAWQLSRQAQPPLCLTWVLDTALNPGKPPPMKCLFWGDCRSWACLV